MDKRVVITGRGTVTPHADRVDELFRQLVAGRSAVRRIQAFDATGLGSVVAAEVTYPVDAPDTIGPYDGRPRAMRFAVAAAQRALSEAGLDADGDRRRRAVHLSVGVGSTVLEGLGPALLEAWPDADAAADMPAFRAAAAGHPAAELAVEEWFLDQAAPALGVLLGAGRVATAASACASGSHVILDGVNLIRRGAADIVLAGGVCTPVTRSMIPGFALLSALTGHIGDPAEASRPFDGLRDGFIMAEGASCLVLESWGSARARGAEIIAEVVGVGIATDAYRLTDPEPGGRGMAQAMRLALADAGVAPAAIGYINAHGTSTKLNDAAETRAIKTVFGPRGEAPPVSSSKSMFGHLIHAAGVTEAIVCTESLRQGVLHPTINQTSPDPDCDLDYIPNVARDARIDHALSNSFGFGGQNVSIVLGRPGRA